MLITVDIPDGTKLDGAVVELSDKRGAPVKADVRIPAPEEP